MTVGGWSGEEPREIEVSREPLPCTCLTSDFTFTRQTLVLSLPHGGVNGGIRMANILLKVTRLTRVGDGI